MIRTFGNSASQKSNAQKNRTSRMHDWHSTIIDPMSTRKRCEEAEHTLTYKKSGEAKILLYLF